MIAREDGDTVLDQFTTPNSSKPSNKHEVFFEEHGKRLGTGLLGLVYLKLCLTDIPCGLTALFPRCRQGSSKEPPMIGHAFHVPPFTF